jgi:NAD(P)-dependent dehydrogenase (short-subunit alcohol dehydrogenase family)
MSERRGVLVNGASSGIGEATALRFAREGWDVCLNARRKSMLEALVERMEPGNHLVCPGDYSDPGVTQAIGETIASRWGKLDALINNAGVFWPVHATETPVDEWRRQFDIMVNGAINLTRACVPLMKKGGRIVYVTSVHAFQAFPEASSYAMAKAAINQYARNLALELADRNILVNAIAPGFVDTPMSIVDGENELEGEWFKLYYGEGPFLPLRRGAQPEEIAGVAFFLTGPDASYITGQVVVVDGGLTITS